MCVQVRCVSRSSGGSLLAIGGNEDDGSQPWGLSSAEAIARIESGEWSFFVARPAADPVAVLVRTIGGTKVLTTAPDDTQTNNLANLPDCASPLTATEPQFPLSIPGPRQPTMVELLGPGPPHSGPVKVNPGANGHFRVTNWSATRPLQRLRLVCNAPFPANLELYVDSDPTRPDYVEAQHKLVRVDSTSPEQVRQQEDAGTGWYDWTLSLPDASYPHRFTPFVVQVGVPAKQGKSVGFTLFVRNVSYNRFCAGPSTPLSVVVDRATYAPQYTYPPIGSSSGPSTKAPARAYTAGLFTPWAPAVRNVGQSATNGVSRRLEVQSATDAGMAATDWPEWGVYTDPSTNPPKRLCQPLGFGVLTGMGSTGGIGFSPSASFGIALAIEQPHAPGYAGDTLFRFVKLGATASSSMDVEGFVTTPTATVTPRILLDAGEQVALIVDANHGGAPATPGRVRLVDLGHAANSLREIPFDGVTLSAKVVARSGGGFDAAITTDAGTTTVHLPSS